MLYHIIHSPFEQLSLAQCLPRLRPGQDQLLLSRDAVIAVAAPQWQAQLAALAVPVYVLAEDLVITSYSIHYTKLYDKNTASAAIWVYKPLPSAVSMPSF